jgi:hypothetical protein
MFAFEHVGRSEVKRFQPAAAAAAAAAAVHQVLCHAVPGESA